MAETTQIIKKYYYSKKNYKFDTVISQIETITAIMAKLIKSDFLAVYFKRDNDSKIIPVSFHNSTTTPVVKYEMLDKIWKHKHIEINSKDNLFLQFTPQEIENNKYLVFLKEYGYSHLGYLPG